ncbi:unnamed protein product [Leptidea sinapis]|uniref:Uncharacterized protein n=1 Tax=Leptidea sinapis TaxID=189913 RepID=A0A5E4QRX5_9NEOP|nr:unnamed protein product [Leptidea sinapis]
MHRINTRDAAPVTSPPYRVSSAKKEIIRRDRVSYLGHVVSTRGIKPDSQKVEAVPAETSE